MRFFNFVNVVFQITIFSTLTSASTNEKFVVTREIVIESCDETGKCNEVERASQLEPNAVIALSRFRKGHSQGLHGENKFEVVFEDVSFKGKVFVNKVKDAYSIYTVLRSGQGTERIGVSKKVLIQRASEIEPIVLTDHPILIRGKSYQAKLTVRLSEQSRTN